MQIDIMAKTAISRTKKPVAKRTEKSFYVAVLLGSYAVMHYNVKLARKNMKPMDVVAKFKETINATDDGRLLTKKFDTKAEANAFILGMQTIDEFRELQAAVIVEAIQK
jgi:hypothetical protein